MCRLKPQGVTPCNVYRWYLSVGGYSILILEKQGVLSLLWIRKGYWLALQVGRKYMDSKM